MTTMDARRRTVGELVDAVAETADEIRERYRMGDQTPVSLQVVEPTTEPRRRWARAVSVNRWHRMWFHRWTPWSDVFSSTKGGIVAVFSGHEAGPWWQSRRCIVCGREDRRRVELGAGE